jgi:hypothetical protein
MNLQRGSQSTATKSKESMCSCSFRLGSSLSIDRTSVQRCSPGLGSFASRKPNELLEAAPQLIGERLKRGHKSQLHIDCKPSFRIINRRRRPGRLSQTSLPLSAERDSPTAVTTSAKSSLGLSTRLPSRSLCTLACRHCLSSTSLSTRLACWLDSCLVPTMKAKPRPRESLGKDGRAQT